MPIVIDYNVVCQQNYCKSNQPISLKLDIMIGPIPVRRIG